MRLSMILFPLAVLAACSGVGSDQAAFAKPPATPKAVVTKVENKTYSFSYSYPAAAAAIPALKAQLDAERAKAQREIAEYAAEGAQEAKSDGREFNAYDRSVDWTVVATVPGWLSLSGNFYEFTGGAHGNSGSMRMLWDKAAGRARDPVDLFTSRKAFDAALGRAYCVALNKERAVRRDAPVDPKSENMFDECLAPSEVTVLLGSSDGKHFNRVGLIADAYVAGPYAEGSYEVTLPVSPALLKVVKPQYRALFALGR